ARLDSRGRSGSLITTRNVRDLLGSSALFRTLGDDAVEITTLTELPVRARESGPKAPAQAAVERALPEIVVQRLHAGQAEFLAESRTVSVVFVDVARREPPVLASLHETVTTLVDLVARFDGAVYQFLEDDKGTTLIVSFGAPPRTHEDDAARAALFANAA